MKKKHASPISPFQPKTLFLVMIAAVSMCIFFVLFVISNSHWTPVFIPNLPWQSSPVLAAFETPFIVAIVSSLALGSIATAMISRIIYARKVQQQLVLKNYIVKLEGELEKTQRLITSTNLKEKPEQGE